MTGLGRLPASAGELERCRVWMLTTFGRADARGDRTLQTYVIDVTVLWDRMSKLLRPWRRWAPWQKASTQRRGWALKIGYRARRCAGRYAPRKRRRSPAGAA